MGMMMSARRWVADDSPPRRVVPPARVFIGKLAFAAILSDFHLLGV